MKDSSKLTRREILKSVIVLPALAALVTPDLADAASKRQAGYQNHPGPHGQKCSGCRFFKKPHSCSLVSGTISPNGWCRFWARK